MEDAEEPPRVFRVDEEDGVERDNEAGWRASDGRNSLLKRDSCCSAPKEIRSVQIQNVRE